MWPWKITGLGKIREKSLVHTLSVSLKADSWGCEWLCTLWRHLKARLSWPEGNIVISIRWRQEEGRTEKDWMQRPLEVGQVQQAFLEMVREGCLNWRWISDYFGFGYICLRIMRHWEMGPKFSHQISFCVACPVRSGAEFSTCPILPLLEDFWILDFQIWVQLCCEGGRGRCRDREV